MKLMPFEHWQNDWNTIIREIIYPDEELKRLMMVPEGTSIIDFIDKYFVRIGTATMTLTNEPVRIVYGDSQSEDTDVPFVKKNELSFDIYVRLQEAHNVGNDRLMMRSQLIENRLYRLLTQSRYQGGYRFWPGSGGRDLGTTTLGYSRRNITFYYMRTF